MASAGTAHPPDPAEHRELQKRIASEALRTDPAQLTGLPDRAHLPRGHRDPRREHRPGDPQPVSPRDRPQPVRGRDAPLALRRRQHEAADPVARHRRTRSPGHPLAHAPPGLRRPGGRGDPAQGSGTAPTVPTSASRASAYSSKSSTYARAATSRRSRSRYSRTPSPTSTASLPTKRSSSSSTTSPPQSKSTTPRPARCAVSTASATSSSCPGPASSQGPLFTVSPRIQPNPRVEPHLSSSSMSNWAARARPPVTAHPAAGEVLAGGARRCSVVR